MYIPYERVGIEISSYINTENICISFYSDDSLIWAPIVRKSH